LYFEQTPAPTKILIGAQGADETVVDALTACRQANSAWYLCVPVGYAKADLILLAAYVESASPACIMFATTADADVKAGTAGNLCLTLQASKDRRTLTQYSTYADAAAAIAGYVCGSNDGTQAFDLAFKNESGVTPDALTSMDISKLSGENCNYYTTYQNTYSFFYPGNMADGTAFDEVLGIDMLTADIQSNVMSVLTNESKVPLTDDGISLVTAAITNACETARTRGFISAGTWNGSNVVSLKTGDGLTNGYSIQADSVSTLSAAQRSERKAPQIYVCIILANSARSFTITVNVNR
jgi:hypothetical protein